MKISNILCSLMLLAGISSSGTALADHGHGGHVGFGIYIGGPYPYGYPYYPYPYPYYPPVVITPAQPPVYVEQSSPQQSPPQVAPVSQVNQFWYHCEKPEGYYPYIKECPNGWQKVVPTPPPQQ